MSALELYPHIVEGAFNRVINWGVQTGEQPNPFKHHLETYQAGDTTYEVYAGIKGAYYPKDGDGRVMCLPTGVLEVSMTNKKDKKPVQPLRYLEMGFQFDAEGNLTGLDETGIKVWCHTDDGEYVYHVTYVQDKTPDYEDLARVGSVQRYDIKTGGEPVSLGVENGLMEIGTKPYLPIRINWVDTLGRYLTGRDYIYDKPITGEDIQALPLV